MELLAHVAEMLPYWLGEVERILAGPPEPVPFGRVGSDPGLSSEPAGERIFAAASRALIEVHRRLIEDP